MKTGQHTNTPPIWARFLTGKFSHFFCISEQEYQNRDKLKLVLSPTQGLYLLEKIQIKPFIEEHLSTRIDVDDPQQHSDVWGCKSQSAWLRRLCVTDKKRQYSFIARNPIFKMNKEGRETRVRFSHYISKKNNIGLEEDSRYYIVTYCKGGGERRLTKQDILDQK